MKWNDLTSCVYFYVHNAMKITLSIKRVSSRKCSDRSQICRILQGKFIGNWFCGRLTGLDYIF